MSREMTSDMAAAVAAATVKPCIFVEVQYPGGTVRLNSGLTTQTLNGNSFSGVGTVGTIADIEESLDDAPGSATIEFPANSAMVAAALGASARGRTVKIWIGAHNLSTGTLIADPVVEFSGTVSHHGGPGDPRAGAITLVCVDESADQERPLEQLYTDEEQQRLHPGDLGCQYVASLPNKEFTWGNAAAKIATPVAPPSTDGESEG